MTVAGIVYLNLMFLNVLGLVYDSRLNHRPKCNVSQCICVRVCVYILN